MTALPGHGSGATRRSPLLTLPGVQGQQLLLVCVKLCPRTLLRASCHGPHQRGRYTQKAERVAQECGPRAPAAVGGLSCVPGKGAPSWRTGRPTPWRARADGRHSGKLPQPRKEGALGHMHWKLAEAGARRSRAPAATHSPHSSPSCAISMRAKVKDSSSLHLNHLSTTCGQGPDRQLQEGLRQCAAGVGTPAAFATAPMAAVRAAATLSGHSPAPVLGSETHVYTLRTFYFSRVPRTLQGAVKTACWLLPDGHTACRRGSTSPN